MPSFMQEVFNHLKTSTYGLYWIDGDDEERFECYENLPAAEKRALTIQDENDISRARCIEIVELSPRSVYSARMWSKQEAAKC